MDRYDRQERIEGWDQEKLKEAKVAIIGDDKLAQYTALPLAALGVGEIRIIGDSDGGRFLDFKAGHGSTVKYLDDCIESTNPQVDVIGITGRLSNQSAEYFIDDCDLVIDTTNDQASKAIASLSSKYMSATLSDNEGIFNYKSEDNPSVNDMFALEGKQDPISSIIMGGVIAGEAKTALFEKYSDVTKDPVIYSSVSDERNEFTHDSSYDADYSDKKVLVVGAGALGNFVGLGLAEMGMGNVDIIDDDIIEETNLNRQILYYDSVGEEKARTLSKKMQKINRNTKVKTINKRFETDFEGEYDLIFDCVDNFETRANVSDFAARTKTPLISGGTDYKSGQVANYIPEESACMSCQLNFIELKQKREVEAQSCILAPNPSVIFTNQVIGGMMVNEARNVLSGKNKLRGRLNYNTGVDGRIVRSDTVGECNHG